MSRSLSAVVSKSVVLAGLLCAVPLPAHAQSYAVTVWNQLNAQYNRLSDEGFSSSKYIIGRLKDIDLALVDANRKELVNDTSADDVPVMTYAIRTTGVYTVKVTMFQCSQDPCYFGLGVFFK